MTGLIASDFMDDVVDSVKIESLGLLCEICTALGCTILCISAHFQILLGGIGEHFAKQFSKMCSMLCFFHSCLLIESTDLRISFTDGLTAHGKIHADFRAFTVEHFTQAVLDFFGSVGSNTDYMLASPNFFGFLLDELGGRSLADGAAFRSLFSFVNITAD